MIKGISTQIKPGEITAIIGSSGQGKTTMLNLIRHDYDLVSGSIKLGSKDITSLSDDEINKQISFIDQRVQFFDQTLLYNLFLISFVICDIIFSYDLIQTYNFAYFPSLSHALV